MYVRRGVALTFSSRVMFDTITCARERAEAHDPSPVMLATYTVDVNYTYLLYNEDKSSSFMMQDSREGSTAGDCP